MITRRAFVARGAAAGLAASLHASALPAPQAAPPSLPPLLTYEAAAGPNSLGAHGARHGLLMGTAVDAGLLRTDPLYSKVIADQYSLVVAENAMKWEVLRPTPETYNFTQADALVGFAQTHGIKVRGHNFVWHQQLPSWFATTVTRENAEKFLTDHIHSVGRRYAGKIHSWDVVNEAQDANSSEPELLRPGSPWFQLLGPGYIETAFKAARSADPRALLTLNDYGIEYESDAPKRNAMLALLRRLKANNVPVDAVGIQSHLAADSAGRIGPGIQRFVQEAGALGLQVFITELDMNDDPVASDDPPVRDRAVAAAYRAYLSAVAGEPSLSAIVTWGFTDRATWLNGNRTHLARHPGRMERSLPFDADYRPTPAFFAIRDSIDARHQDA